MIESSTLKEIQRLDEEPLLDIDTETATIPEQRKRISITINESLINVLTSMQQEITRLNKEIRDLSAKLEKQNNLVEDNNIRTYIIKHALNDKDWVEPDELFEIKTG